MLNVKEILKRAILSATYYESNIIITGGNRVLIENVKHIYEINEIMARIKTTQGDVTIWGNDLKARGYKGSTVTVSGRISSCELEENGK